MDAHPAPRGKHVLAHLGCASPWPAPAPGPDARRRRSSGSTPTPPASVRPRVGHEPRRRLRRGLDERRPGRQRLRHLRPALRRGGRAAGRRVPGQHLHDGLPGLPAVAVGSQGRLRRGLGRAAPGRLGDGIFGQRFDAAGAPLGGEFQVNTFTTGTQYLPHVGRAADGRFVVVWTSSTPTAARTGSSASASTPAGSPWAASSVVNTYTTGYQVYGRRRRRRRRQLRGRVGGLAATATAPAPASSASATTPRAPGWAASSR